MPVASRQFHNDQQSTLTVGRVRGREEGQDAANRALDLKTGQSRLAAHRQTCQLAEHVRPPGKLRKLLPVSRQVGPARRSQTYTTGERSASRQSLLSPIPRQTGRHTPDRGSSSASGADRIFPDRRRWRVRVAPRLLLKYNTRAARALADPHKAELISKTQAVRIPATRGYLRQVGPGQGRFADQLGSREEGCRHGRLHVV